LFSTLTIRSGPGFCSNPRPPSSLRQDDAKADAPVVVLALHLVALRHRAVDRPVVEAAAAEHALRLVPKVGPPPCGMARTSLTYVSWHYSQTFPDMSNRPIWFGAFRATS
jgi:hypothetical protein